MMLRSFIQRDDRQIREYLEQLEGGLVEGPVLESQEWKDDTEGGVELAIGPLGGSLGRGRGSSGSSEARISRGPAAGFQRLYDHLEATNSIERLEGCSDQDIEAVELGQIVEIQATGRMSRQDQQLLQLRRTAEQMSEAARQAGELEKLIDPFMDAAKSIDVDLASSNPDFAGNVDKIRRVSTLSFPTIEGPARIAVVGAPVGYSRDVFAIALTVGTLLKESHELNDEYVVFGKVIKKSAQEIHTTLRSCHRCQGL